MDTFVQAFSLAVSGDIRSSISYLQQIPDRELRQWYVEHGHMSGWHRVKTLNLPRPPKFAGELDSPVISAQLLADVFLRDGNHCRYCGSRVINPKALAKFSKIVSSEHFVASGGSNLKRHGIALNFRATADHVVPRKQGGRTDVNNLVTSCWGCNYGKSDATLEQLGLDDPRLRAPIKTNDWIGLWPVNF